MQGTHSGDHASSRNAYVFAWVALMALTAATFGVSYLPLGTWGLPVALVIAGTKALVVILVFMHLLDHPNGAKLGLAVSFFFVALLTAGSITDVATRFLPARPADLHAGEESGQP